MPLFAVWAIKSLLTDKGMRKNADGSGGHLLRPEGARR